MADSTSHQSMISGTLEQLARIIRLDETTSGHWTEQDLQAMLRHQMDAPLEFDLSSVELVPAKQQTRSRALEDAARARVRTFAELFKHPAPPLALLKLAKDFFKGQAGSSVKRLPEQELAYLFYLLSIVTARVRLQTTISRLNDRDLIKATDWCLARAWIDKKTRQILLVAKRELAAKSARQAAACCNRK